MKLRICFAFLIGALFITEGYSQKQVLLEEVVALALEHNYDVRISKNVLEAAKTDDDYAFGAFIPQLNGSGSRVWNNNNQKLEFQDAARNNSG
jgi:outer membrane protein TolC